MGITHFIKKSPVGLLDALNRSKFLIETTLEELVAIINTHSRKPRITFTYANLPPEGPNHNKPLYIIIRCLGNTILAYMVDNGLALNVCALRTSARLRLDEFNFTPSTQSI